ncbi:DUF1380 domain-containing protein [Pantoea sp. Al-1710]|uniref:DUF1380 domain-containing protein n=1 Tax=Candidatus Pantoea communis TaxID=2608354 RepID=A0ABX0S0G1_9GAMM|nr:DUF1380 domain-containing protein [Pantoea communis]
MMHGSVIDICKNLADDFGPEESVAVLVWTKADVMDCGECMEITEDEAGRCSAPLVMRGITLNTVLARIVCVRC